MSDKIEAEIIDDIELDEDAELEIDDLDLEDIELLDEEDYEEDEPSGIKVGDKVSHREFEGDGYNGRVIGFHRGSTPKGTHGIVVKTSKGEENTHTGEWMKESLDEEYDEHMANYIKKAQHHLKKARYHDDLYQKTNHNDKDHFHHGNLADDHYSEYDKHVSKIKKAGLDPKKFGLDEEVEELDEATAAADTLRPKGAPGESKAQTLATFVELLSQLGKEDLSHIHNQVQNQYGPNKGPGNHGDQATNRNTIKAKASDAKGTGAMAPMPMPKLMVREDVEEMFAGNELSEEFKDKASTIFEAALNTRINIELVKLSEEFDELNNELHEEYEDKLAEAVEAHTTDLEQRLENYLDHVTENWMAENALQIESTLRAELAESFIHSLKNVFEEHYVEVPEEKFDVIKEMREEIEELKTSLNRSLDENLELKTSVAAMDIEATINDLSEGLTVTQASKLQQLSEGLEYSDSETFRKKLEIIKENYFNKKTPSSTGLITESIDGEDTTVEDLGIDPVMSQYAKAISKN